MGAQKFHQAGIQDHDFPMSYGMKQLIRLNEHSLQSMKSDIHDVK